mgnify:FL=1
MFFTTRFVSSLEKVFCQPELSAERIDGVSGAGGETIAFQLACKSNGNHIIEFHMESEIADLISLREVGLVPCLMPAMPQDPFIITSKAGIFPDPLLPLERNRIRLTRENWHAVWCTVRIPENMKPGEYEVRFSISTPETPLWPQPELNYATSIRVKVLPFNLPKQKLLSINWFYADCIQAYYNVPCWSEKHWELLEKYFVNMVQHGNNVILTPLWSVPLDTAVGYERPTAQLLDITYENGRYQFDFSLLERWIDTAKRAGFEHFEMSHAFTQWGAKATPKIIVKENGVEQKRFGWHVAANSPEYKEFLTQLTAVLIPFFRKKGLNEDNTFFHVSDEPTPAVADSYEYASKLLGGLIGDYPVIDALSSVEFFRKGLIKRPVPTTTHLKDFLNETLEQRWVYYCGTWENGVPNRQFGMPSARNRVLGVLLYLYDLDGFLNWGYNFWFTQHSLNWHIDPYQVVDAGRAFCGGGAFMVYPGKEDAVDSLHYEVFAEGLQDLRALRLLEEKIGREETLKLIQEGVEYPITINTYPREAEWLLNLRDRINRRICG